jgi:long-chain fatty acid transport protein
MKRRVIFAAALAAWGILAAGPVRAGGYDSGETDWDFIFQQRMVGFEAGVRHVSPQRRLKGITGTLGPSPDVGETEAFTLPRASLAVSVENAASCMLSYREPWAGHADYGAAWTYAAAAVEQHFSSRDYGLTCAAHLSSGRSRISFLGGVSQQEVRYRLTQSFGPGGPAATDVSDRSLAWRVGLAYEIPDYALRASLIYNSAVRYDMAGTYSAFGVTLPVAGTITLPQSVELKLQSGVAPGWLAFAAVKWTDWSVVQSMPLCAAGTPACTPLAAVSGLSLGFRDAWTVTAGAAHQFSELLTLAASLSWQQGASAGFTSQTDVWVLGLTGVVTPSENAELKLGGALGLLTAGTASTLILPGGFPNPLGYTASFGNDLVWSLSGALTVRF